LDDFALGCLDHWILHLQDVAIRVQKDGHLEVQISGNERRLNQLEVELFG
jgi:hypothetical protein